MQVDLVLFNICWKSIEYRAYRYELKKSLIYSQVLIIWKQESLWSRTDFVTKSATTRNFFAGCIGLQPNNRKIATLLTIRKAMLQTKKTSYKRQIFLMSSKETETFVVNRELYTVMAGCSCWRQLSNPAVVVVFYSPLAMLWALNWGWDMRFGRLIVEGDDSSLIQQISWLALF